MPQFDYVAPASVDEAIKALMGAPEARVLAGGTDLIVQMRAGRVRPGAVVDVKRIPGAVGVSVTLIGHAETGRLWQSRRFWERVDAARASYGDA